MNKKLFRKIKWENTSLNKIILYPKDIIKGVNNNNLNFSFHIFSSNLKD